MHLEKEIVPPRSLTHRERSLLDHLLTVFFPGSDKLRMQAKHSLVSGECTCGCPSIVITVNRSFVEKAVVNRRIPIEAEGVDSDGMPIHVLLHVVDGYLSELEIYREDSAKILSLPDAASFEVLNLDADGQ